MFKKIYIEISNICNVQCSFCPVVDRDKKVMLIEPFSKILEQVKPLTKRITLHLMGEPTAHPLFREVLSTCQRHEMATELTTNGLLIERYGDALLKNSAIVQINFSLQSYQDNFAQKDIKGYLKPILKFCHRAIKLRPDLYINLRLWNIGDHRLSNRSIYDELESFFGVSLNRKSQVEHIKSKKIISRVYLHFDSRFEWPSLKAPYQGDKGRCYALSDQLGIHADATVVPCCLDKEAVINLGNCLEQPLLEILNSPQAKRIRDGFAQQKRVEKLCQHCQYINRFSPKSKKHKTKQCVVT